ncbi:MAG: ATP-binding protein [Candidatus Caldatribacteriota bacterium]|nr:ATP-binding protein [Candidatus Caldatribacteriota bacterium]
MDKNEIIKLLGDWNFWDKDLNAGINRPYYLNKIKKFHKSSHIIVITGARRSGKSFIMRQTAKNLPKADIKKNNILIVNFEDPRFVELNTETLQQIYDVYLEFLDPQEKPYLFLDEIQEVKDWEKWVRTIHELDKAKIIISGSNAKLLSRELSTLLTGRHLDLVIFPLSFKEFLRFRNIDLSKRLEIVNKEIEIKRLLREYIEFGSFPEVVLGGEKKQILLNYFEDILNKDIVRRFKIRKSKELVSLAKFYLGNISSLITFSSMERTLNISVDTVEKFSRYLEDTFILFFLKRFSYKFREQEKSPRKVYAIDVGLANTVGFRFSQNMGRLAENLVFLELKRKEILGSNLEIYYWKDVNHREVDFLIKENLKVKQLIQVCWEVNRPETKNREIRALLKAMKEFNLEEGLIITDDYEAEENIKGKKINYIPLWKWYLKVDK